MTKEEIEMLEAHSRRIAQQAESVRAEYERLNRSRTQLDAHIAALRGDHSRARWLRLVADPQATREERHAAYIRVQAESVLQSDGALSGIPEEQHAEVLAEVERLRAAQGGATEH